MDHKYNLLVVDLDGTLVSAHGSISEADKKALTEVRAQGVIVALSTGRVIEACRNFIVELNLNGVHIFFDGALLYDLNNRTIVEAQPIPFETLKSAVDFARANAIYLELYTIDRYFVEEITWAEKIHREFFGLTATLADFDTTIRQEKIIKCELMIHNDEEDRKARLFLGYFEGKLYGSAARTPAYPDMRFINVVVPTVSKGASLEKLASHLGFNMSQVMVIGDGTNDLPLLEKAGLKIAMGNAREELKAVADDITLSVDESGVAAAINKYLL